MILALLGVAIAVLVVPLVIKPDLLDSIKTTITLEWIRNYFEDSDFKDLTDTLQSEVEITVVFVPLPPNNYKRLFKVLNCE